MFHAMSIQIPNRFHEHIEMSKVPVQGISGL